MPEEIPTTVEVPQPAEPKPTNWPKIILAAVLGFGLLIGAVSAGYWYGTQQTQPAEVPTLLESSPSDKKIGGPCEYDIYQGICIIISTEKNEASKSQKGVGGGPAYEGFEIRYQFENKDAIPQRWHELVFREHTLTLANSWYPGPRFIEKYEIEPNKKFDCAVRLITKGTCSPVIFDFEDIDTMDYFETKQ